MAVVLGKPAHTGAMETAGPDNSNRVLLVSALPQHTTCGQVEGYCETFGSDIEIVSVTMLSEGKAQVEINGLLDEGKYKPE